ncbi:MAG TPA: hypothetical protein V6C96_00760 [Vampirovibrionales bacterium]
MGELNHMEVYKLHSLNSTIGELKHCSFEWFVLDRSHQSMDSYWKMMSNYFTLSGPTRLLAEEFLKESFTFEESQLFEQYLMAFHNASVQFRKIQLPMQYIGDQPIKTYTPHASSGFIELKDSCPNYNLPFEIGGYYRLPIKPRAFQRTLKPLSQKGVDQKGIHFEKLCKTSEEKSGHSIQNSVSYLRKALRIINPQLVLDAERLEDISKILSAQGYQVGKNHKNKPLISEY